MKPPYYITTPIYYVTDAPHIGHLYSTLAADIMARYQRECGKEVWFLTGTDEHGQKIEKKAKELGETPAALADRVVERYRQAWKYYDITNNDFIRTSEDRHKKVVQEFVTKLIQTGDIYLAEYEGWYCVPDEAYWTDSQVIDGKCPDCGRPVERLKEESYFFKMSAYQDRLLEHIKKNPKFIVPESRKNEVVSFVEQGLRDLSVSRTTIQWGIPIPPNGKATKSHSVYVWFDALSNYYTALVSQQNVDTFWKEAIHIVGKDILRFHAVYWPTFLMALGLPLPKQIVAHGWLTDSNRKISKSLGNMVDPISLGNEVGKEGVRYFLFREFVFGLDGEYTKQALYQRINADLANDYGNCVSRVCNLAEKNLTGKIDAASNAAALAKDSDVKQACLENVPLFHQALNDFGYHKALEAAWKIVSTINRFVEAKAPWALAKNQQWEELSFVLLHSIEGLRIVSLLAHPFLPEATRKALESLDDQESLQAKIPMEHAAWGKRTKTATLVPKKGAALFPRLEFKEEA